MIRLVGLASPLYAAGCFVYNAATAMTDALLVDPLGRRIELRDRTWFGHVLKGHPEVAPFRGLAEAAVTRPLEIRFSTSDPDCRVYYGKGPVPRLRLAVIADVRSGSVKTAYLARKASAGGVEWSSQTH